MRKFLLLLLCFVLLGGSISAQEDLDDHRATMIGLLQRLSEPGEESYAEIVNTLDAIAVSDDPLYIAPLLDLGYFTRASQFGLLNEALYRGLERLTGESFGQDWQAYFEWASENDIALPDGYDTWKGTLFGSVIDPNFQQFFQDVQGTANVNLLEAVWGGVRVDGIPSLVNARQITPEEAAPQGEFFCPGDDCVYPETDEFVFGVYINGNARAYPLRLLNWHEMFNDVIGSVPVYDTPDGDVVCNYLAPLAFVAIGQQDGEWLKVRELQQHCDVDEGWITEPESYIWSGATWEEVIEQLPEETDITDDTDRFTGRVTGTPVMLAYCTLCGSGILFNPIVEINGNETTLEFGSTGMLMRSNKLMYDRATNTVWNALTGEPAFGPLADDDIQLERLPVVVTDWATWLEEHPDTTVLSLDTGFGRNYANGAAYSDYFNDPEFIMFPVWQQDTSQNENKEVVFTLLIEDTPKAYPLKTIIPEGVTNDTLAGLDLVIVSRETPQRQFFEPGGASVRAYERGDFTFSPGESHREVVDQNGDVWRVTEDALVGPDDATLERLPGHLAFWFGWYGFYPETLLYE